MSRKIIRYTNRTLLLFAALFVSFSSPYQPCSVSNRIEQLLEEGANPVIEYYVQEEHPGIYIDSAGNECSKPLTFLFWKCDGKYFGQKFECFSPCAVGSLPACLLVDTIQNNLRAVMEAKIRGLQHRSSDGTLHLRYNEGRVTRINIHFKDRFIDKWIYHDPINKTVIDSTMVNDNYEWNQKSILNVIRILAEKESSELP